ncbi:MAG TPA: alpha/beta hydrolase [Mycobacteriales bacterium]|jgi:haloacetate dehalogenase|nr:alpha/beta hydrolase [Mycobacteriales bacterium]
MADVRTVVAADTVFLLREGAAGAGTGTPVLLLHGAPETSSCWRDLVPRLALGRRVLAPDLPGLGGSSYPGPYDVRSLVTQVAALLEAEGTGPVDVVGHDWGGIVAIGLAGLRPDLVRRLVVANAPYRQGPPPYRAVHIPLLALPVLPELAFRLAGRRLVDLMLDLGWRSEPPLDEERRAEYAAAYTGRDRLQAFLGYYRAAARPRPGALLPGSALSQALPEVDLEHVMVLWGALDPVLPLSIGEAAVRDLGPRTRMTTIPNAGHFVVEEAPDVVGDVLVDFLG